MFQRYVAVGDSFTEGVGDDDTTRPNGLRGWADMVAEQIARHNPDLLYANLAVRGRLMDRIIAEQVDVAVEMHPDLVTINAGSNDVLRPILDLDGMMQKYEVAIGKLAATGATVVVFAAYDTVASKLYQWFRGRAAVYNELLRGIAIRQKAVLVDSWQFSEYSDERMWSRDRLHLSALGHRNMAARVLETLGVPHVLEPIQSGPLPPLAPTAQVWSDLLWAKDFAMPWVGRRVRGVSSGDKVTPKRPTLLPVLPPRH